MKRAPLAFLLGLGLLGPSVAHAEPLGSYQKHFVGFVGVRTAFVRHPGLDAFADDDALVQFALGGGRTLVVRDRFSLAVVGLWEYGARSADVRGDQTSLDVHRLSLGPEIRVHFVPWLYGFVRALPAAVHTRASLQEAASGTTLFDRDWTFGFDATGGAAFQLYGKASGASKKPRLWAFAEGGYGWAMSTSVVLRPEAGDEVAPHRMTGVDLGTLAIRGGFFRISLALTF